MSYQLPHIKNVLIVYTRKGVINRLSDNILCVCMLLLLDNSLMIDQYTF